MQRFLVLVCLGFAGLGLLIAYAGTSSPFAPWRTAAAVALFGRATLPEALGPLLPASFGILGGSIVGKWVAAWLLVRGPLARGNAWAWHALALGLISWWVVDSGASVVQGAAFNVWMINLAPIVLFGLPLVAARRHIQAAPHRPQLTGAERALARICLAFAALGVVVALAPTSFLFAPYRQAMAATWFDGVLPTQARTWVAFIFGPIGGTFTGHFAMLALAVSRDANRAEAGHIVALSVLAWFLVDSSTGVLHGAWFNLLLINAPTLLILGPAWWLARSRPAVIGP